MAITYPLTFPTAPPRTQRLVLNYRQQLAESSWTFASQTVNTSAQWVLEWSWPPMTHANAETLSAWLLSLKGQVGTFTYRPYQSVASTVTIKTLDAVAYAYTNTIVTKGWIANAATTLRAGQFVRIGTQLLRLVEANAVATGDGKATITFEPALRSQFPINATVTFTAPSGVFRLSSSEGYGFTLDPDKLPDLGTIQAREVI